LGFSNLKNDPNFAAGMTFYRVSEDSCNDCTGSFRYGTGRAAVWVRDTAQRWKLSQYMYNDLDDGDSSIYSYNYSHPNHFPGYGYNEYISQ
jgi:hypothetical protein